MKERDQENKIEQQIREGGRKLRNKERKIIKEEAKQSEEMTGSGQADYHIFIEIICLNIHASLI